MSVLQSLFAQPLVIRAGWTLVHFLWQGSVIAIVLAVLRGAAGAWLGARARYALSCMAMAVMCAAPPLTFVVLGTLDPSALPRPIWPVDAGGAWERMLPWVVVAWFCGAALFSARVALGWRMAMKVRNAAIELPPPEWQESLERLVRRMRISAPVRLLLSPLATAPAVVGWLKPVIVMPVEAMIGMSLDQVRSLLAHELAHIRRNDYLVNILQSLAEALLFYHPAVWWVSGQIRAERELCCDDIAVEASGDVLTYVTALAALETSRRARLRAAMAADGGSLLKRIRRLAGEADPPAQSFSGAGAALALALLWLAGAGAVVMQANQPQPAREFRLFTPPVVAKAPQMYLDPPPVATPRPAPLVSALLFNPFLAMPQAALPPAANDEEKKLASLSGTVFSTAGKAVANATVRLVPVNAAQTAVVNSASGPVMMQSSAQAIPIARTDADGKFSLTRVPPGSYTVQFQHKDFLAATYGARPGLSTGTVLTLDEGRSMTGIDMKLPEPGTFVGRTLDADGDPLAHMLVDAQVKRYYYPQARGEYFAQAWSGDDGKFRLTLPPGRYYITARMRTKWSVNGQTPVQAVKPGQKAFTPGTTYWPGGANNFKNASPVEVGPGQIVNLGDCKMANFPLSHVRGKVLGDPALLKGARVVKVPPPNGPLPWTEGADIQADGSFDLADVYPYDYTIGAYSMNGSVSGWLGITDLVVGDEDVNGVQISAMAAPLSGSVVVENVAPDSQAQGVALDSHAAAMPKRIELTSAGYYKVNLTAPINPDGTFTIRTVAQGSYFVNVTGLAPGTYVRSARFNGHDILAETLDWGGPVNGGIEMTISQKAPALAGSVVDADGNPVAATVTLVADPQRPGHLLLYPTANADQNGNFRFQSAAPGSYRVLAWETIPGGAHAVPDFINPFIGVAERIELKEGDQKTMVLKRISLASADDTLRRAGQ